MLENKENHLCVKVLQEEEYKESLTRTVEELGQEKRQEILDLLFTGINVGKIGDKLQIETIIVSQVIVDNIESNYSISKKAK